MPAIAGREACEDVVTPPHCRCAEQLPFRIVIIYVRQSTHAMQGRPRGNKLVSRVPLSCGMESVATVPARANTPSMDVESAIIH
jgi:hypothetical protein